MTSRKICHTARSGPDGTFSWAHPARGGVAWREEGLYLRRWQRRSQSRRQAATSPATRCQNRLCHLAGPPTPTTLRKSWPGRSRRTVQVLGRAERTPGRPSRRPRGPRERKTACRCQRKGRPGVVPGEPADSAFPRANRDRRGLPPCLGSLGQLSLPLPRRGRTRFSPLAEAHEEGSVSFLMTSILPGVREGV
jgi:hypothetical protein